MGKINVTGSAKKEYNYDEVILTISFFARKLTTKEAMSQVNEQLESFLAQLKAAGFSLDMVKLEDDRISNHYYEERENVEINRCLTITMANEVKSLNYMIDLLANSNYSVNYNQQYQLSDNSERENELLVAAVADSRKKAEMLAQSVNSKIIGIDNIGFHNYPYNQPVMLRSKFAEADECFGLINEVSSKTTMLEKEIEVVWIIE